MQRLHGRGGVVVDDGANGDGPGSTAATAGRYTLNQQRQTGKQHRHLLGLCRPSSGDEHRLAKGIFIFVPMLSSNHVMSKAREIPASRGSSRMAGSCGPWCGGSWPVRQLQQLLGRGGVWPVRARALGRGRGGRGTERRAWIRGFTVVDNITAQAEANIDLLALTLDLANLSTAFARNVGIQECTRLCWCSA
ncbi:hypothetical protein PVAP13_2KG180074 [Panicum virgatum]|uniref:Uncharacterized protein n=1 Tax=Panicum virgatum TaxID=38727 RepID=A0A8T0VZK9_PANVG|nr:hypothetical protein PVAP13_2KG180074 [Panicum virgatum]